MDFNLNLGCIDNGNLEGISEDTLYDVLVIGTGPAAVSAAVYAARKGLATAMIGLKIGGQVLDTKDIENIIGTSKITGSEYAENLEKHLKEYCVALKEGTYVTGIEEDGKNKVVATSDKKKYKTKTIVIATGAKWRELNVPGEREYKGKGVHYCATCDGPFYKGLDVAIVGGVRHPVWRGHQPRGRDHRHGRERQDHRKERCLVCLQRREDRPGPRQRPRVSAREP